MSFIGASEEVLRHHFAQHCKEHGVDQLPGEQRWCPCGESVIFVCDLCEYPVFLAIEKDEPCEHAAESMRLMGLIR